VGALGFSSVNDVFVTYALSQALACASSLYQPRPSTASSTTWAISINTLISKAVYVASVAYVTHSYSGSR
jgi:hypothetical protein